MNKFTPKEMASLLDATIPAHLPVLTVSAPGIGKSALYKQAAERCGFDYVVLHPSTLDPVDLSGMPVPVESADGKKVMRVLDDLLSDVFCAKRNTLLLLDELGQASQSMQAACAPILLDRRIGKNKLPDCVTVCAATNSRKHRSGASQILTHIISRIACIAELTIDPASWYEWAIKNKIRSEIISFLKFRAALLHNFEAEKNYEEMSAYATPRSWENLSKIMDTGIDKGIELAAFSGCVGVAAATEFNSHLTLCREMPNIDEAIANPKKFKFPKNQAARYAVSTGIALRCAENPANVLKIIEIIHGESGEFSAVALRDALIADTKLMSRPEFSKFSSSKTAKYILSV